ncbi:MAG: FecR domain-containing protein [Cyclobacteriaceae bacterium]
MLKSNPKGIKSVITLSDGSRVTLNSESTISYPRRFHGDKRVVVLEGEAFFEVEKDKEHPFVVVSGNTSTTALGTSFNIRHYPNETESYISLATGKVKVESNAGGRTEGEILLPGEQIVASKDMITFKKKNYDYKEVFLWKEKVIYWNHASWQEIANTLERWYGVSVEVNGLMKEISYSGQFDDQSLENVLVSMGYTLGFNHTLNDNKKIVQIEFTNQ